MTRAGERVEALFEAWFAHREQGAMAEADRILLANPDVADELRARIHALALLDEVLEDELPARARPAREGRLGPYRLVAEIGSGGMGTVYRAEVVGEVAGLARGTLVAVKVVHRHLLRRHGFLERFRREVEIGQRAVHRNVVRTHTCGTAVAGGVSEHFLVLEHVEGQTLRSFIEELGRVPEELCRHVGREVARALSAVHAVGAVHRDLKPENVLITKDHLVKLMDLGVARLTDDAAAISQTGAFVGSLLYAAPEQLCAGGAVTVRVDLFALGLLLYEMATGVHPFRHDDVRVVLRKIAEETPRPCSEIEPQLSPFFEALVHELLAKDPHGRPVSADDVLTVLEDGEGSAWWRQRSQAVRRAGQRAPRRMRAPRDTALYGRDEELRRLGGLYARAKAGEGQVVLVEGEAGIGKSRVVDEFVGRLEREGEPMTLLIGTHPPGGAATATGALASAFLEHFGELGLEDALRPRLAQAPGLVQAFAAHLRGEPRPAHEEPLGRDALQAAFVHVARSLAAERPTIVWIEDLHFATEEARGLFAALAFGGRGHRLLLIGTSRPGLPPAWRSSLEGELALTRLVPARLGPKDLTRLLVDALGSEHLAEDLTFQIAAKSDGNPFFVFEILRGLKEGRFLTRRPDGTWITTDGLREARVPPSLVGVVEARLSGLDPEEREALDVAACCGFEFDPLLVSHAAGVPPLVLLQRLARIERSHRLVRSVGALCTFDHHVVQETIVARLSEPLRAAYHAAIGDALEARAGAASMVAQDLEGNLCVALAEHFLLGGLGARAERYLAAAFAHLEAQDRLEAGVRLCDLALGLARPLAPGARADALCSRAAALWRLGRTQDACATAAEAVHLTGESGDIETRFRAAGSLAEVLGATSRERARLETAEKALEFARLCGARVEDADGSGGGGITPGPTTEWQERSAALCRQLGSRRGEMYAILSLAIESHRVGHLGAARTGYERGLALAREIQAHRALATNQVWLGGVLTALGLAAEAHECLERGIEALDRLGARLSESLAWHHLGELERESGDPQRAFSAFERALAIREGLGDAVAAAETRLSRGVLLERLGRVEEARADFAAVLRAPQGGAHAELSVLATAHAASLPGGTAALAIERLERYGRRLPATWAMEARFALWQATGDPAHLADARRRLDLLVERAPPECRASMLTKVFLHQAIVEAGAAAG